MIKGKGKTLRPSADGPLELSGLPDPSSYQYTGHGLKKVDPPVLTTVEDNRCPKPTGIKTAKNSKR